MTQASGRRHLGLCTAWLSGVCLLVALVPASQAADTTASVVSECGDPFGNSVGPYDYNNGDDRTKADRIPIVEKFHFTPVVESLARGSTSENAMGDLDYTLRAIPNHPRALNAVARYEVERKGIPSKWRPAECWFERAFKFRPDDGTVWLIYANYKARKEQSEDALAAYKRAKELLPDNVEVDYNMGLLYFKLGQYENAVERAKAAYAGNFPLQGLRKKLANKGYVLDN